MDLVGKLFDVHKLPFKVVLWVALGSGILVFAPKGFQAQLGLEKFMAANAGWVGIAFVGSASLVAVNGIGWLVNGVKSRLKKARWLAGLQATIEDMDRSEKAVLREFFIQGKHVIELPIDDSAVVGLMKKGVIRRQGTIGTQIAAGFIFPCDIAPEARRLLTYPLLELPTGTLTEAQKEHIRRSRPDFARAIDNHNYLFRS